MIDFSKPVQTIQGIPVTIISTEARGEHPVIGYIGESKILVWWSLNGECVVNTLHKNLRKKLDLENAPEYWAKEKEAFKAGKAIQFRSKWGDWTDALKPVWTPPTAESEPKYRIKPELAPLTKDDIKAGDIFLRKDGYEFQWTARSVNAIMLGSFWRDYKELKEKGWKIKSLDSDWRPCEKEASGE